MRIRIGLGIMSMVMILLSACQTADVSIVTSTPTELVTEEPVITDQMESTAVPSRTATLYPVPTEAGTATPYAYDGLNCYTDNLPYAYAESSAVVGWKYFAEREQLTYQAIYFPDSCTKEDIEADIEHLFFTSTEASQTTLLLLDKVSFGRLGILNSHLWLYDFWAMGPEDYPMVMETNRYVNPNIIVIRIDRLNGEGHEGNEILGLMVGLGEHEYIHTVQARNNPNLADMIWSDGVYRAVIERYANLNNNSGGRYYMASYSYLSLLQMVDGLKEMGEFETAVSTVLAEMGYTVEEYKEQSYVNYDSHMDALLISVAGQNYLKHLTSDPFNALLLVKRVGLGDITSYDLVRTLYDRYISDYNLWYYGGNKEQYLPDTFDTLFEPSE